MLDFAPHGTRPNEVGRVKAVGIGAAIGAVLFLIPGSESGADAVGNAVTGAIAGGLLALPVLFFRGFRRGVRDKD